MSDSDVEKGKDYIANPHEETERLANDSTDFIPQEKPELQPSNITNATAPTTSTQNSVSLAWIYLLCIANFGISGAWSLEFALVTPFFEKGLESGSVLSHAVWIVGPVSGLIVAPIVGSLSDRCTSKWGRRRPFILGGIIVTFLGMIVFSHSQDIASLMFEHNSSEHHTAAIIVAIVSFSVLDLAINTTMWPVRALQGDLVPEHQQHTVQSAAMVMGGLGDLAVNVMIKFFDEPVFHIRSCFLIAAAFYTVTTISLVFAGRETPADPNDAAIKDANGKASLNILTYLQGLPGWMWRVGGTYGLGFFAFFCTMPNASSWLGSSVLGGDPTAPKGSEGAKLYERGVNLYGKAGLWRAAVSIGFSAVYPKLLDCGIQPGHLLGATFAGYSVLVLSFAGTQNELMGQLLVVAMALPMAAQLTLPVGVTVEKSDESNRGRYLGALNCFAVIPQLIDTAYTGVVARAFGEATVMMIGGAWGLLTAVSSCVLMQRLR